MAAHDPRAGSLDDPVARGGLEVFRNWIVVHDFRLQRVVCSGGLESRPRMVAAIGDDSLAPREPLADIVEQKRRASWSGRRGRS